MNGHILAKYWKNNNEYLDDSSMWHFDNFTEVIHTLIMRNSNWIDDAYEVSYNVAKYGDEMLEEADA